LLLYYAYSILIRLIHFCLQTIVGKFAKEQEKFVTAKKEHAKRSEAAVPPWVGYNEEETMKSQILALSTVCVYTL